MSTAPAPAPAEPRATLPHDLDAERTLLGAVLVDNGAWTQVGRLKAQDFYRDGHRRIFVALQHIGSRGGEMDLVTLKAQLGGDLQAAGGPGYLAGLLDGLPRITNLTSWVAIVRRHALLRSIHHIGQRLATATLEDDADPQEILERADAHLLKVMSSGSMGSGLLDNAQLAKAALENIEARAAAPQGILGYRTGIESLDGIVKGIRDASMVIIGARLGEGKSMLAMQICEAIGAQAPDRVVVCSSLEMDGVRLTERRLAASSCVNPTTLWAAAEHEKQDRWDRLTKAVGPVSRSNVRILQDCWTVRELRAHCRVAQQDHGLAAVCVDYCQLLDPDTPSHGQRRNEVVAAMSKALRKLAAELHVPVIVVAQLNREAKDRKGGDARPSMEHLAESDGLGRDAHLAILIQQDPIDPDTKRPDRGKAALIVAKNREGRRGETRVRFRGDIAQFVDEEAGT
jgi:replicative DNA helicase